MAYVVARRSGRFEIRESLHTPDGPRARSLAGFDVLTGEVLARAARRSQRPFDADAVLASARRAGAPTTAESQRDLFVRASRHMARTLRPTPARPLSDPGAALIDLLGFVDALTASQPRRPFAALEFPVLSALLEERRPCERPV